VKSKLPIVVLTFFVILCPPGLTQTVAQKSQPATDAYKYDATNLAKHVGSRITVQGPLMKIQNGRVGIIVGEKSATQISIDPLPCPTLGEVTFKFVVNEFHQTTKKPKYHRRSPKNWMGSDARRKKLDHLIEQCEFGDSIELTGKLCHLTAMTSGNVQKNIGYPRIPDSHFFFSVDDVTLVPITAHTQK
jgi:hypothetical protein